MALSIVRFIAHPIRYTVLTREKGDVSMGGLWILSAFLVMGLCLAKGHRLRFLRDVASLLYLPVATLVSLIKKCK